MDAQEGCGVYAGSGEELLRGLMSRGLASVVSAGGGATRAPRDVPSGGAGGRNGVSGESRPRRARGLEGVWGVPRCRSGTAISAGRRNLRAVLTGSARS